MDKQTNHSYQHRNLSHLKSNLIIEKGINLLFIIVLVCSTFLAKKYGLLSVILRIKKFSENVVYVRHFEKTTLLEKNVDSLFRNVPRYYKAL